MTDITQRQRRARIAAWLVSLATTIVGVVLLATGKTTVWVSDPDSPNTFTSQTGQGGFGGVAILSIGILSVMALLIAEGYTSIRYKESTTEAPIQVSGPGELVQDAIGDQR